MTRRFILTSATLAAFLAAGTPLPGIHPLARRSEPTADLVESHTRLPTLVALGDDWLGVQCFGPAEPGSSIAVALFVPDDAVVSAGIRLWAGIKNGWGSQASRSEAVVGTSGLHLASVAIPDPLPSQARLWVGLDRAEGRALATSVALPSG